MRLWDSELRLWLIPLLLALIIPVTLAIAYSVSPDKPSTEPEETARQETLDPEVFWQAAREGSWEKVQQAIEAGQDVNAADSKGQTALLLAAFAGHTKTVRLLLDAGATIEHQDFLGHTALMAASSSNNAATVRLLLKEGADPNVSDYGEGYTALMFAAAEGQTEVVRALIKQGAKVDQRDVDGDSARDFAMRNRHRDIVTLLENQ